MIFLIWPNQPFFVEIFAFDMQMFLETATPGNEIFDSKFGGTWKMLFS